MTDMHDVTHVQILVVEDNPRYADTLRESLMTKFGYQHIVLAENSQQAFEQLDAGYFDVIIADMRLNEDDLGGFEVLREVNARNITSIVIILTANDNYLDCREALRGKAWDYWSKNMPGKDVHAVLHQSILNGLEEIKKYGNREDALWIKKEQAALLNDYPNQYIAVMNNAVIDSDVDQQALQARMYDRRLPIGSITIEKMVVEDVTQLPIAELIGHGEGGQVEFKETFRCDTQTGKKSELVEHSALKTIAAFLNTTGGGVLLIGVSDNGSITGLDADYAIFSEQTDWDGFSRCLAGQISTSFGGAITEYVDIDRHVIEGREIAVVRVKKAQFPVFLKEKKNNNKEAFYIRFGSRSDALDSAQTWRYLNQ